MSAAFTITNIAVFDAPNGKMRDGTFNVRVDGGQIRTVQQVTSETPQPNGEVIDGTGKFLLPGLIDAHVHICAIFTDEPELSTLWYGPKQIQRNMEVALRTGFTTLRDMMSPIKLLNSFRTKVSKGDIAGPRILTPGPFITPEHGYPHFVPSQNLVEKSMVGTLREFVSTPDEAEEAIIRLHRERADFVKIAIIDHAFDANQSAIPCLDDATIMRMCEVAHRLGVKVAVHQSWRDGWRKAVTMPIDTLEHLPMDEPLSVEDAERAAQRQLALIPTQKCGQDLAIKDPMTHRNWEAVNDPASALAVFEEPVLAAVKDGARNRWSPKYSAIEPYEVSKQAFEVAPLSFERILKAGCRIGSGTDAGVPVTFFCHLRQELELAVENGMTPGQALRAATSENADIIGLGDTLGRIEAGKIADMIIADEDPTEDIRNIYRLNTIFKAGEAHKPLTVAGDPFHNEHRTSGARAHA